MEIKDEEIIYVGVDCQNDFIDGALPNPRAQAKVQAICEKIRNHKGPLIMTHDTHFTKEQVNCNWPPASGVAYEESLEGTKDGKGIPVHCIKLSEGYQIQKDILAACKSLNEEGKPARFFAIDKYTFGWDGWKDYLRFFKFKKIVIFGFVAGICVDRGKHRRKRVKTALKRNFPQGHGLGLLGTR